MLQFVQNVKQFPYMLEQSVPYVVLNGYDPGCTSYMYHMHMSHEAMKQVVTGAFYDQQLKLFCFVEDKTFHFKVIGMMGPSF